MLTISSRTAPEGLQYTFISGCMSRSSFRRRTYHPPSRSSATAQTIVPATGLELASASLSQRTLYFFHFHDKTLIPRWGLRFLVASRASSTGSQRQPMPHRFSLSVRSWKQPRYGQSLPGSAWFSTSVWGIGTGDSSLSERATAT
jgi:hypothetical protein